MKRGDTAEYAVGDDDTIKIKPLVSGMLIAFGVNEEIVVLTPAQAKSIGQGLLGAYLTMREAEREAAE